MTLFEDAYQAFLAAGGFTQRCLAEDMERHYAARQQALPTAERCIHGLTQLTCHACYLHFQKGPR